jgi:hypothetical protein
MQERLFQQQQQQQQQEQVSPASRSILSSSWNDYNNLTRAVGSVALCAPASASNDCFKISDFSSDLQPILIFRWFAEEHLLTRSNTGEPRPRDTPVN